MEDADFRVEPPACAVRYAAQLEVFPPRQGQGTFSRTPLEVEVSLGEQTFRDPASDDEVGFKLRFSRVVIEVIVDRGRISRSDRYQRTLPADEFKQHLRRFLESSRSKEGEIKGGLAIRLGRLLNVLGFNFDVSGKAARGSKRGSVESTESNLTFKLVRWVGAGRWEIGHPEFGDPREIDSLLRGAYLADPADSKTSDDYSPLCYLEPDSDTKYSAVIELRARLSDCVYIPLGKSLPEPAWALRNRHLIEKRLVEKMLQDQARAAGLEPPDGEVILARGRLDITKKS